MEILTDEQFSTKVFSEATETEPSRSHIYVNKKASHSVVDGTILEVCIKYKDFYLVFMTDDIPYEDTLRISLLDRDFCTLDYISLGSPYTTGAFRLLEISVPDTVVFQFFGETLWNLKLSSRKHLFIPFISEPRGVHRKFRFSRYFKISGSPIPESA